MTDELRIVVTSEGGQRELLGSYISGDEEGVGIFYTPDGSDVRWAADDVCEVVTVPVASGPTDSIDAAGSVLDVLGRLQDETDGTELAPLVGQLVAAMAADTTAVELRQEVEHLRAEAETRR